MRLPGSLPAGAHRARLHLPGFLVGAAAAAAGEIAAALLLYSGSGLVEALTLVLAAELAALGVGLWSARSPSGGDERGHRTTIRRRWLFALVAFSAAAAFAAAWPLLVREGTTALGQGLGLALLAVLPLYAAGSVLGSLAGGGRRISVAATFGAAAGVLATGVLLTRVLRPVTLLLLCVTAVAGGALAHAPEAPAAEPGADADESSPEPGGSDPDTAPDPEAAPDPEPTPDPHPGPDPEVAPDPEAPPSTERAG